VFAFDEEIGSPTDGQLWTCGELARTFQLLRIQAAHIGEFRLTDHRLDDTVEPFVVAKTTANADSEELLARRWGVKRDAILDAAEDLAPLVPEDPKARGDLAKWKERFAMTFVSGSICSLKRSDLTFPTAQASSRSRHGRYQHSRPRTVAAVYGFAELGEHARAPSSGQSLSVGGRTSCA
jgi:hypothetical protein